MARRFSQQLKGFPIHSNLLNHRESAVRKNASVEQLTALLGLALLGTNQSILRDATADVEIRPGNPANLHINQRLDGISIAQFAGPHTTASGSGQPIDCTHTTNLPNQQYLLDGIEITQAIQAYPRVEDVRPVPQVPIVDGKTATMRVYLTQNPTVDGSGMSDFSLSYQADAGSISDSGSLSHQNFSCSPSQQRSGVQGCWQKNLYFTPLGQSEASFRLIGADSSGVPVVDELIHCTIQAESVKPLTLYAVDICDPICPSAKKTLDRAAGRIRSIFPTEWVEILPTIIQIPEDISQYSNAEVWLQAVLDKLKKLSGWVSDSSDGMSKIIGVFRKELLNLDLDGDNKPDIWYSGEAFGIPGQGAIVRSEAGFHLIAHEVAHTFGRRHTRNTRDSASRLSCKSYDSQTDYPMFKDDHLYVGNDTVSSQPGVGYAVQGIIDGTGAIKPSSYYELMSYCGIETNTWISGFTYTKLFEAFRNESASAALSSLQNGVVDGQQWWVWGVIAGDEARDLEIIERQSRATSVSAGGNFRIEIRDESGLPLYTHWFEPTRPPPEWLEDEDQVSRWFNEPVPVDLAAASIAILDASDSLYGEIMLGGDKPEVTLDLRVSGKAAGRTRDQQASLSWNIVDPDSSNHRAWVSYSADDGKPGSWRLLRPDIDDTSVTIPFADLPGTVRRSNSRFEVLVTDGVNSTTVLSEPFQVPTKSPQCEILTPPPKAELESGRGVVFEGSAWDPEDGPLNGDSVSWITNRDGFLGTGKQLVLTGLSPGLHWIVMTAKDSEGNRCRAWVRVKSVKPR